MNINLKFKELIADKGIKQSYICKKTGMTADCVSRMLKSTRKITAEEFLMLCELSDVDPKDFSNL